MRLIMISVCLFGLSRQEGPDPARWIEQLGRDELEKRDEAARRLKDIGDSVIPHLRPLLKSTDAEVASRAKEIIDYLERTRRARALLATGKPFSLDVPKPVALPEIMNRLGAHFGLSVEVAEALKAATWSGKLENLKLLQAMDRLAADCGFAYAVLPGRVRIGQGKFIRRPCDYPGSFKVMVSEVSTSSRVDFSNNGTSLHLVLEAAHQTNLIAVPETALLVQSIEFDTGELIRTDLLKEKDKWVDPFHDPGSLPLRFTNPPEKAKSIRSIKGVMVLRVPAAYDSWTIENVKEGGKSKEETAVVRAIDRGTYKGLEYFTLYITVSGRPARANLPPMPLEFGEVKLLSKEGAEAPIPPHWPVHHVWDTSGETYGVEARFILPRDAKFEPATAVVRIAREFETVELPFEIRDVPMR